MLNSLVRVAGAALTLVYPPRCAACDRICDEGAPFCASCEIAVEPVQASCARCALPQPVPVPRCLGCLARAPPQAASWSGAELGGSVARAVRRMKYAGHPELARPLARLMPRAPLGLCDLIAPVPLHPRRLRERQFNQAALLALAWAPRDGPPVDAFALERVRDTPPQSSLSAAERQANVRGAFTARIDRVLGKRVLVVDDVVTTGATVEACARAVKRAGAREVLVLTVARAVP